MSAVVPIAMTACRQKPAQQTTPWGSTINLEGEEGDTATAGGQHLSLDDIKQNGEMIMLTLSGPTTYYEYRGRSLGVNYLMAEKLAEHLGVTLRVDVCRDTLDMLQRLRQGEGDIIAMPVRMSQQKGMRACGLHTVPKSKTAGAEEASWVVAGGNAELAEAVDAWYRPEMYAETQKEQDELFASGMVTRRVNPFMLSAEKGTISVYDGLFRKYASVAGMDWTLMAAQCYQESCFDPQAHSWAGACGLMQIMPATADHLQLPRSRMYDPEANVAASARYMRELQEHFKDVGNPGERMKFALAAYNGGFFHVRDAMALTKKHGGQWQRWDDVKRYVLALAQPEYYQDPVVKSGYMRGSETANYVDMIMSRWQQYRQALRTGGKVVSAVKAPHASSKAKAQQPVDVVPAHRASKKNKWRKE